MSKRGLTRGLSPSYRITAFDIVGISKLTKELYGRAENAWDAEDVSTVKRTVLLKQESFMKHS